MNPPAWVTKHDDLLGDVCDASRLADALLVNLPLLRKAAPRDAQLALHRLSPEGWAAAAAVANVGMPSRGVQIMTAGLVRSRMENPR